jgi:type I restriction enzyme R subunit
MPTKKPAHEAEWKTRKQRIDPRLDAGGWPRRSAPPSAKPFRTEEEETANGPADYALWLENKVVGIVEAKKLTVGPQNVLTQAARYARGLSPDVASGNFDGLHAPFLYSTNGEVIWFQDVRHPLNRSRRIAELHTSNALKEMFGRDADAECAKALALPHDHPRLRPYQKEANAAVEKAIADRKRNLLVAMATGTGKTFTLVNQIYRLMKAGVAKRVLFLVDRRALAAQAVRAFSAFEVEPGKMFDQVYEVYSSRFQTEDFGEEEKFDPKVLPQKYLTDPQPGHAFVFVATIQRMAMNVLGRQAIFDLGDEAVDADADRLDIPVHAFDVIVADECHRGYTSQEVSTWRSTLDHFDAIKIGLTATPASHTTAYFANKVFEYGYEQAVREGHLVDYDAVYVHSDVRMNGLFLKEGENVEIVDPNTGLSRLDTLEDEREFDMAAIEREATSPESNKKILLELKKHTDEHERLHGRSPKTLIFAVNDLPHTSHANQIVDLAREVFGKGDQFVVKITGSKDVDRPLQRIREFRNRPTPCIAVTVDMLTTGVDIPDLEFIVFLRPVKSRILFEQMIGRGTRKGEKYPDKDHFTVFDCFDGTLLKYFKDTTGITKEEPVKPTRTVQEIVDDIWANQDRDYNIGCLVKRLQRIDKSMSGEAREMFAKFVPNGDLAAFARNLPSTLRQDFVPTMDLLKNADLQELLVSYPRPQRTFVKAYEQGDNVFSVLMLRDVAGNEYKPADYLQVFSKFVAENPDHIDAVRILLDRPRAWGPAALTELRLKLGQSRYRFSVENLQRAHEATYSKALVDVISMVKHAAREDEPLYTASERVERAFAKVTSGKAFTPEQQKWLDRIREHLRANLSIDQDDFEVIPIFADAGGWGVAKKAFGASNLEFLLYEFNEAIAA